MMRLDLACVHEHLAQSRNQAKELIKKGCICVDGKIINKPSALISLQAKLSLCSHWPIFVSRAGEKLWGFLLDLDLDLLDARALDIGASKGGFTQALLEKGAREVVCVDVGTNQFDLHLSRHPKVRLYEQTDIRDFAHNCSLEFDVVVCDVSFISLEHILPCIHKLARKIIILLYKPQFEVGIATRRNKKGVISHQDAIKSLERFLISLRAYDWKIQSTKPSIIKGKEGNEEFFILAQHQ